MNERADRSSRDSPPPPGGVLLSSHDSGGAFTLMEYDIPARTLVGPLHTHHREDEYTYLVNGTLGAQIGDSTLLARPHEFIAKPRGIPHTLWNPSDDPTRVLELIAPGGFERCLQELYRPGTRSPAELEQLWHEYGIDMDSASAPILMSRHSLNNLATG